MSLTGAISGAQIRAARILLGWSQAELSCRCGVSESSIAKIEGGWLGARNSTRGKIALALIGSGINFIDSVGVRLWPNMQIER
jgi:predicted transcriptional regulator